jgi:hypothetical protein
MSEQIKSLWSQLETAKKKIPDGGSGAEKVYAGIYQQIVRLGGAQQLKKCYR